MTGTNMMIQGDSRVNNVIDASNCLLSDSFNNRYLGLLNTPYSTNALTSTTPVVYLGSVAPNTTITGADGNNPVSILTPSSLSLYESNLFKDTNNKYSNLLTNSSIRVGLPQNQYTDIQGGTFSYFRTVNSLFSFTNSFLQYTYNSFLSPTANGIFLYDLENNDINANNIEGVGAIRFYKQKSYQYLKKEDILGGIRYFADKSSSSVEDVSRQYTIIKNITGNYATSTIFQNTVNNQLTTQLELDGSANRMVSYQPLDMCGNSIITTNGNLVLDASTNNSSSTGYIKLVSNTYDEINNTGGIQIDCNNITKATAGVSAGYMVVTINGTKYKMPLYTY